MLTNLTPINTEQAENLLRFYIKSGDNVFLLGTPGVGKTELSISSILAAGYKCNYLNLSVLERPDLAGVPDVYSKSEVIEYKSPHFLPALKDNEHPSQVLLLDEIDKAPLENTFPVLEVLRSRTINDKRLNIAAVILTGNLPEHWSGSNQLSKALLDRGAKYELKFDAERWMQWARSHSVHDLILGFLQYNPGLICGELDYDKLAFPTPRSWTAASNAILKAKEMKLTDIETVSSIVSGFVGEAVGTQFRTWLEHFKRFEPAALNLVEKGISPSGYDDWSPTEQIVFVISAAHIARLRFIAASKTKPKYAHVERLVSFLETVEPELQALAITNSFPLDMVVDPKFALYKNAEFFSMSQRLSGK